MKEWARNRPKRPPSRPATPRSPTTSPSSPQNCSAQDDLRYQVIRVCVTRDGALCSSRTSTPGGHQHDHSVVGTHYVLRLQCNETSSISFAIMYGLAGDPNSRRLNRNATETRVHCLWNNPIETASLATGCLVIWDKGVYEVLPYRHSERRGQTDTDDEAGGADERGGGYGGVQGWTKLSEPQKLARAAYRAENLDSAARHEAAEGLHIADEVDERELPRRAAWKAEDKAQWRGSGTENPKQAGHAGEDRRGFR